jgi:hypothetical protein
MRTLLVDGVKRFKITIPDDSIITFGPFSPPPKNKSEFYNDRDKAGTLRVYSSDKKQMLGVFTFVSSFRDTSIDYMEEVAKEEGATLWKSDEQGYVREDKMNRTYQWVRPEMQITDGKENKKNRKK